MNAYLVHEEMEIIDAHIHALPRGEMNGGEVDARFPTEDIDRQIQSMREVIRPEHQEAVFNQNILKLGARLGWWAN